MSRERGAEWARVSGLSFTQLMLTGPSVCWRWAHSASARMQLAVPGSHPPPILSPVCQPLNPPLSSGCGELVGVHSLPLRASAHSSAVGGGPSPHPFQGRTPCQPGSLDFSDCMTF